MKIKTSTLVQGKHAITKQQASKAMLEREDIRKEVKRLLLKHDLTLENIIKKYKSIYDHTPEQVKASDILKVLERLEKLHDIHDEQAQSTQNILVMLSGKDDKQIEQYLQDITSKTQTYLARLKSNKK